jgi:ribosomal protein L44E
LGWPIDNARVANIACNQQELAAVCRLRRGPHAEVRQGQREYKRENSMPASTMPGAILALNHSA